MKLLHSFCVCVLLALLVVAGCSAADGVQKTPAPLPDSLDDDLPDLGPDRPYTLPLLA